MSVTTPSLHELRLVFAPGDEGAFKVQLEDEPEHAVGSPRSFKPFLEDSDFEDLRWYLEEYMDLPDGGAVVRARRVEDQITKWGRELYEAIFAPPENSQLLKELLAAPEPRELTIATDQSALLRLPWELLRDDAGSLAQRLSVRRQLKAPESLVPREVRLPLRMLYIISRPADAGFIDPRLTPRSLLAAIDPLEGNVRVDFCRPPTLAQMEEMLRDAEVGGDPYDVVHFDGHGTFLPQLQLGALCFEKPDDGSGKSETELVRADRLGDLLAKQKIPLVVLEACRSATVGKAAVFRSVAPRLIQAGVGSVLSMGHAVHVEAARLLLDRFYRELARGATIGHATAEARRALVATRTRWIEPGPSGRTISLQDWFLPHLYQRGLDEPLLPPKIAVQKSVRKFDAFLSHNHNDSVRVESLARELSEKQGIRVWLDKLECKPGRLEPQCEAGISDSRFTVVVGSQNALDSKWVAWEIEKHQELNPEGDRLLPIKFEKLKLPPDLDGLLWVDFTDPAKDQENAALLTRYIRSADAEDARRKRGFRSPPDYRQPGAFPRPPQYGFQGRARELYELERLFRRDRGIVLHAMGGMGKTSLATEASNWWTQSGLFRDGACFISFEQFASAERVISVLGEYCEGPNFHQRPPSEQRRRAIEFFQERAMLLVWDNFESTLPQFNVADKEGITLGSSPYTDDERTRLRDLFQDLTIGPGKGCILVTCRPGETRLPSARKFELQGLARPDSLWLLHRILERDGVTLDDRQLTRDKLEPLLDDLADHPLSLELVGPHLRRMTPEQIREDFGNLMTTMKQDVEEGRNQSLLASLEFSRRHLSEKARTALPWLGLFSGGVFEDIFLDVSQIDPKEWETIRAELEGIALLRAETDIQIQDRPFLRFHPTLSIASADPTLSAKPETRERYVGAYIALTRSLDKAFVGSQSQAAIKILDREEMNYRTAVRWAILDQRPQVAAGLGETFSRYLQLSARIRERNAWIQMLRDALAESRFSEEIASFEGDYAWTLFTQGDPDGAVNRLRALIERLRETTEFDPAFQLAATTRMLGRVLSNSGASTEALPVLREAISLWETLVERAAGKSSETLLKGSDFSKGRAELSNLSSTMGDLANSLAGCGQYDEALRIAETGFAVDQALGDQVAIASGNIQSAAILVKLGRYDQADTRYEVALQAARRAGDREAEGTILQHQGSLADDRGQFERAIGLYQQALQRFQDGSDTGSIMRTYNLLGVTEQKAGRLAEARAWYERSRELAISLNDQSALGAACQNIGIVCQMEGQAERALGNEAAARQHFDQALHFVDESLQIQRDRANKPDEAAALSQLAKIYLRLGDLAAAERHARQAAQIRESLGLIEVLRDYNTLSEIAAARGDPTAAAEWARKRDELLAERKRRAGGGGGLPERLLAAVTQLTMACARAGFGGEELDPQAEEFLATLDQSPPPFPALSAHLRRLAAGELAAIPADLPKDLREMLEQLHKAVQEARE